MFPNDLWITDPNQKKLFKLVNDSITLTIATGDPNDPTDQKSARSVLVSQDMVNVYTVNWDSNTVSQFTNGVHARDILVGNAPYGICEDPNGIIYVTNYLDNTVSKIYRGNVIDTINVHEGPRGIVSDSRGRIYVACYLSCTGDKADDGSFVDEIVNSIVTNSITVGLAPIAVTCDGKDSVWVANYASNTVSKIRNSEKVLDVNISNGVGDLKGPTALVCNSSGVLYVANYLGNTVSVIKDDAYVEDIQVSDAPTAIDVNTDDFVYVLSELESVADKITKETHNVIQIPICDNPSGFGDFTGCATYNCFHGGGASSSSVVPVGGWVLTDMSLDIQQAINAVTIDTDGVLRMDADHCYYPSYATKSSLYPTVKDALDHLLNIAPEIKEFSIGQTVFETGATFGGLSPVQVQWAFNKPMVSADIMFGGAVIGSLADPLNPKAVIDQAGTKVVTTSPVSTNGTITLVATDEAGATVSATIAIEFRDKIRFGTMPFGAALPGQSTISTFHTVNKVSAADWGFPLVSDIYDRYIKFECGAGGVPTIAIPLSQALKDPETQIQAIAGAVTGWADMGTVTYTNGSGGAVNYKIYQLDDEYYGDLYFCIRNLLQYT